MADNRKRLRYVILLVATLAMMFPGQVSQALALSASPEPAGPTPESRLAPAAQVADPLVIDFDQDASGVDIPPATLIDEQYASLGVHFQGGFSAVSRTQCFPNYKTTTSPNLLATYASASADPTNCGPLPPGGVASKVVVLLDFPVDYASIEGRTSADGQRDSDVLTLNAFDANGVQVATDTAAGNSVPPTYTTEGVLVPQVCAQGIRRLEVSPWLTESLDTLTLRQAATPDLVLSQDDGQSSVSAGQMLTYTLTISNAGNYVATGVTLSDTLPVHTSFVAASHEATETLGLVAWPAFDLAPGDAVSRTLTVQVDSRLPAGVTVITNTTGVTDDGSNCADPTPEDNLTNDVDSLETTPDLMLLKDDGQASVARGQVLTYTLTISNTGGRDATSVVVTDTLPAHTSFVAASHEATETLGLVAWPAFDLAAGNAVSRTLTVQVDSRLPAGVTVITNTASATEDGSNGADPTPEDNTASDTDSLEATPDLMLLKDDGQASVAAGQLLTYTLTISNVGNRDASGVLVTDTLPAHTSFVAASHGATETLGLVTWPAFDLAAGAEVSRTLTVQVGSRLPAGVTVITNTASATDDGSNGVDPTPEDNVASDGDVILATPDLAIAKDDGQASVVAGQILTYTLTISNTGGRDATGVLVTDTLPVHASFVAASHEATETLGLVTWPAFDLAAGDVVSRTVSVQVYSRQPAGLEVITNTAGVTDDGSNGADPTPEDNTASDTDSLEAAPDLMLQKDDGQASTTPGQVLTYELTISNVGNQDATGVLVTDTLPAHTSFLGASHGATETLGLVAWPAFDLAAGFYVTRTLSVQVDALLPVEVKAITNTATLSDDGSNGADLTPENNTGNDIDGLAGGVDLQLGKDDGHTSVAPGGVVTYTLTYTNAGRQGASGVTISDTVPASTTFHGGGSSAGWSCNDGDPAGSVCTFPIGSLDVGESGSVTFTLRTAASLAEDVTHILNSASIGDDGSHGPDQNSEDNQAGDSTPVSFTWTGFCNLYPIALHQSLLPGAEGEVLENLISGTQPGNFGWLSWTGAGDAPSLATSLTPPGDSDAYVNPDDAADHAVSAGDWVTGYTGVTNAAAVRQALDALIGRNIVVPVWDATQGTGSNTRYRVASFARVRLTSYNVGLNDFISVELLGYMQCADTGMLQLSPQVAIQVTDGTFSDTVRIEFASQPQMSTDPFENIGLFFDLDASYLDGSPAQPQNPYSLTVTYDPADVPSTIDEGALALYFREGDAWVREPSSQVDPASHTLTAQPDHFSLWAALGTRRALFLPLILNDASSSPETRSTP
jgi:uncharacterized repeat protein (TIGR01451 family)